MCAIQISQKTIHDLPLPRWERAGVRGRRHHIHPHLNPPPSRGRIIFNPFSTFWHKLEIAKYFKKRIPHFVLVDNLS
jgi:hypothetical protein